MTAPAIALLVALFFGLTVLAEWAKLAMADRFQEKKLDRQAAAEKEREECRLTASIARHREDLEHHGRLWAGQEEHYRRLFQMRADAEDQDEPWKRGGS